MAFNGYTKLFSSILASTIWREPNHVRLVWITMLALADKDGVCEASIPGLADLARVPLAECEAALHTLTTPDAYSRTPDHDGRRIEPVDGGWLLLNHAKYREKMNAEERREYLRLKKAESRARQQSVNNGQQKSTESTQAEAEAQADPDPDTKAEEQKSLAAAPLIQSAKEIDKRRQFCAFVGSKIDVPNGLHAELRKGHGGPDPEKELQDWYLALNEQADVEMWRIPQEKAFYPWLKGLYAQKFPPPVISSKKPFSVADAIAREEARRAAK